MKPITLLAAHCVFCSSSPAAESPPLRSRAFGGKGDEGMKKGIPSNTLFSNQEFLSFAIAG
jgi:hypothetical protein